MRKAVVKEWYGGTCEAVTDYIRRFNMILDENVDAEKAKEIFSLKPKALIVPHAGWVYSGFTANFAYRIAQNTKPSSIAVIGPSHKFAFDGISVTLEDSYETPCGILPVNVQLSKELIENFGVQNLEHVHTEHSTEVQMPFIYHYFGNSVPVIEMVYSNYSPEKLKEIIKFLIANNVLVVISSDLSHYYDIKTANALDYNCLEAVAEQDVNKLKNCEACGKIGIEAMILASVEINLASFVVDYRTSADVSGDEKQVVGYMSAIFI
ncbi:AmmeMemoRadiSam system protein B [Nautilia sp. PV-1]|uniref:AmmeMemoRadiSam system protein B n=1 Tax=Nautilia sp. PV-1 TaxID=2579250 RepID=UPI000FDA7A66|nr:AmmeMemoRadiSam system protein B [Nautilia sp. PV-1]AZV46533.1 AmmeMemoRadiSam system protein B [Nautilia sp. PV-1]